MKQIILGLSFTFVVLLTSSTFAADTTTLTVEGMHCAGCKGVLTSKVCEDKTLKTAFAKCSVRWVNKKKQIGEIVIVAKKDTVVDVDAIKAAVKAAGEDYTITVKETK